jgi:ABC-type branched-subunit amino acid transport system ATPase component/ABC-type branched-subunit amino acid transport system permease subunit
VTGLNLGEDRLILLAAAIALAAVLRAVYSKTRFGLATSAIAENRRAASTVGWSAQSVELANFAIAGGLSALAAIFLAPTVGLTVVTLTLLVLPALAGALLGGFSSFSLTVAGAAVIGILQSLLGRYNHTPGVADSVPFLVIVVVMVAGGRARPARGDVASRLPLPGSGRVAIVPLVVGSLIAGILVFQLDPSWVDAITTTAIVAVLILSVVVVTGYAGQLSLCQWALAGFGAWVAARMVATQGAPFWLAALVGLAATVPLGLVLALPAMRTRGLNLAVATLGLALVVQSMILDNIKLTGGLAGTTIGKPSLFGVNLDPIAHPSRYAVLVLVVLVLAGLMVANLRRGRSGRRLLAVRSNERAAASLGVGVYGAKLHAFAVAAFLAAIAGVLTIFRSPTAVFTQFDVFGSITAVQYAVVGGIGWAGGSVVGALLASGGLLAKLVDSLVSIDKWLPIIAGVSVVTILKQSPDGLASMYAAFGRRLRRLWPKALSRPVRPLPAEPRRQRERAVLEMRAIGVRFGGVVALDDVSLTVSPGEVVGLIGPNGAGKTTLLDAVSGFTQPQRGQVLVNGQTINRWSPVRRARAGISRSFQAVELFEEMTVAENLLVAADRQSPSRYLIDLVRPGRQPHSEIMDEVIKDFHLEDVLDRRPSELDHGAGRLVGIARAIVTEPFVVFLDEPAAGLGSAERSELSEVIRLVARRGIAVVLVEHDVPLVLSTCDRVVVLDFGRQIAAGTPDEIRHHPEVIRAYLGSTDDGELAAPALALALTDVAGVEQVLEGRASVLDADQPVAGQKAGM